MRCHRSVVLGLLLAFLAGCSATAKTDKPQANAWMNRFRSLWAGLGPDNIQLEIALVQQPLSDSYLSHELWREVDEQVVPLERRPTLESNGLRLGTISGAVPSGLQRLLTTERLTCIQGHQWEISGTEIDNKNPLCPHCQLRATNRESFVTARRRGVKASDSFFQPLGPGDKPLKVEVAQDGVATPLDYESAQAGLQLLLTLTEEGLVTLHIEPRVHHGAYQRIPHPSEDKASWSFTSGRPEKEFPKLGCDVPLEQGEFLVIGAVPGQTESLGHRCFVQTETGMQTLLVIRTARNDARQPAVAAAQKPSGSGPLPLALQSIMPRRPAQPVSRGQSNEPALP